ncbi:glycosyltransferase [Ramlibacter ginsenosidimutans]|uniref:Glycosyltransferase n=1 Tax=Ramlibacter ginsenosidimutans TaxID=502333 RepID=A0A934TWW6_9BURK|nr:glycosyltransferase [Ramlibacter ginsenosidimutans]MBK6008953.1 glycosyltransferase [Ramlibacter ginsenosidimutans]
MKIVILGLSITSSWGNGHATTYRGLVRELEKRGHEVTFLERDQPWYASSRDLPDPPYGTTVLYGSFDELRDTHVHAVREADLVIVGSYVPDGVRVGEWVQDEAEGLTAFYDIDTPVTLAKMTRGDFEYLHPRQIPGYDLYLSFTGGPTLKRLQREYGSPRARALYCSVDPELYFPEHAPLQWDLGYMGTYSDDRQPSVDAFLLEPARHEPGRKFIVAGPQYPDTGRWPANVTHQPHLPPAQHRAFYNSQRFTLNVTRKDMIAAGWSPSVRLFEAAACGTPIISDRWPGLESLLVPHQEILLVDRTEDVLEILRRTGEDERLRIAERARQRILAEHTAAHRAAEVEQYAVELLSGVAA